jgi:hypothetical protein
MPYAVIIAVVAIGLVLVALVVWRARAARPPPAPSAERDETVPVMPARDARPLTRDELAEKLQRLEEAPALPAQPMAMCYAKAMPPPTSIDYVCPKDGSRTTYSAPTPPGQRIRGLAELRAAARTVSGLSVSVDESELCSRCTPKPPPSPEPVLVVKLPDGAETRTRGVSPDDLILLREFASGELHHRGNDGRETPLKDRLPRIRALIGMPGAEIGKK